MPDSPSTKPKFSSAFNWLHTQNLSLALLHILLSKSSSNLARVISKWQGQAKCENSKGFEACALVQLDWTSWSGHICDILEGSVRKRGRGSIKGSVELPDKKCITNSGLLKPAGLQWSVSNPQQFLTLSTYFSRRSGNHVDLHMREPVKSVKSLLQSMPPHWCGLYPRNNENFVLEDLNYRLQLNNSYKAKHWTRKNSSFKPSKKTN